MNSTKQQSRLNNFTKKNMRNAMDIAGYGIYDLDQECFVGFDTNKGFISIWNEVRKAKLAFSYHTNNTIAERSEEYEIREINSSIELYKKGK